MGWLWRCVRRVANRLARLKRMRPQAVNRPAGDQAGWGSMDHWLPCPIHRPARRVGSEPTRAREREALMDYGEESSSAAADPPDGAESDGAETETGETEDART